MELTENSKGVFSFDWSRRCITKHRHHIKKILKSTIAVVARAEHFTNLIAKRVHTQFGILKYSCHTQSCIFIVSDFFRCQRFELFMGTTLREWQWKHKWTSYTLIDAIDPKMGDWSRQFVHRLLTLEFLFCWKTSDLHNPEALHQKTDFSLDPSY